MADDIHGGHVRLSRTGQGDSGRSGFLCRPGQANVRVQRSLPREPGQPSGHRRSAATNCHSPNGSFWRWQEPIRWIVDQGCRWWIGLLDWILCPDERPAGIRARILPRHAQVLCQDVQVHGGLPRESKRNTRGTNRFGFQETGRFVQAIGRNPRFRRRTAQGTGRRPGGSGSTGRFHGPAGVDPHFFPQNHELHFPGSYSAGAMRRLDAPKQRPDRSRSGRIHQGRGRNQETRGKGTPRKTPRRRLRSQDTRLDDREAQGGSAQPGDPQIACGLGHGFTGGRSFRSRNSTGTQLSRDAKLTEGIETENCTALRCTRTGLVWFDLH
mmetsp:Transcript_26416/g.57889  ORF Transcript_26416/g.57889 Transcript_26416/m.57889 type:complete len:325 (-) Transcript_26416:150-1124(-)